jgi:uncharacterized protein YpuA (DUF1002 family)
MAIALITEHNQVLLISENMEKLKFQYPHYGLFENNHAGKMINISQEDFNLLKEGTNNVTYNGTSLVFETINPIIENKESMDRDIKSLIDIVDNAYKRNQNNVWGTELNSYKQILNNIDTSSINYPYNGTVEKYLKSQGHSVIGTLQIR